LIAGGILLKTRILDKIGFFLLKIWKLLAVGTVAIFGAIRKKIVKKKEAVSKTDDTTPKLE